MTAQESERDGGGTHLLMKLKSPPVHRAIVVPLTIAFALCCVVASFVVAVVGASVGAVVVVDR